MDPALLKTDYDTFVSMKKLRQATAKKLCERSIFHLLPVQQVVMAFEQSGWELDEAVTQLILSRSRRLLGTQIVEDGFKRQSRKQDLQANKRMRLSKVYKVLIERKVLGQFHGFDEVTPTPMELSMQANLPSNAYVSPLKQSVNLRGIIGHNQSPKWYSARPMDQCVVSRPRVLRDCVAAGLSRQDVLDLA